MPMDPYQAARDAAVPQINGASRDLTLSRVLLWAAVLASGGAVTVHPTDLAKWVEGTSKFSATVNTDGSITLKATGAAA